MPLTHHFTRERESGVVVWSNILRKQRKLTKRSITKTICVFGGCCCMDWNKREMEYKACFRLFIFLGQIFLFFFGRFFLLHRLLYTLVAHFSSIYYIYTFSGFLVSKCHTRTLPQPNAWPLMNKNADDGNGNGNRWALSHRNGREKRIYMEINKSLWNIIHIYTLCVDKNVFHSMLFAKRAQRSRDQTNTEYVH